jgi:integrase
MPKRNPPHLSRDVDRHGNERLYVRMPGQGKIRIREEYDTPAFWSAYRDALAGRTKPVPKRKGKQSPAPQGSFRALCERYYASAEFKGLDASTRRVRRSLLDRFCLMRAKDGHEFGILPYRAMLPRHVRTVRDRLAETPGAANGMIKALRQLYKHAVLNDLADTNPAAVVEYFPAVKAGGIPAWSRADVERFEDCHPVGTMARLALVLFTEFGQRISDIHRLGPPMVDAGTITFTQWKNRNRNPVTLTLPMSDALVAALAATPHGDETFLVTAYGRPFASTAAFGNKFRDWCREAGLTDRSAHGLRKYFSAMLAEQGASDREIMSFTGHKTSKEVDRYTRSADQKRLARNARKRLDEGDFVPPKSDEPRSGTKMSDNTLVELTSFEALVPRRGLRFRVEKLLILLYCMCRSVKNVSHRRGAIGFCPDASVRVAIARH